jgi:alpha-tubulin suppressor-like RCC1 family protein
VTLLLPLAVGAMTLTGCVADPAPQMVGAVAGDHSATVTWQAPLGIPFPIVAYVVTPLINNVAQTPIRFDSTATTETVTGLTNGTRYTFEVKAINTLGNDSASSAASGLAIPPGVTAVTTNFAHTCALTASRTVYCWGLNDFGQLGDNTTTDSHTPVEVTGAGSDGIVTQVAAGLIHTCALLDEGQVYCWGDNEDGQLGDSNTLSSLWPIPVGTPNDPINTATAIASGGYHSCALLAGGTIKCWGYNASGQLGDGTTTTSTTPVTVTGISTATAIAAGDQHTCALLADGTVKCWGVNNVGQLGNGTTTNSTVPVTVTGAGSTATAISAGREDTCATDFGVRCWGDNSYGQLGFSNGNTYSDTPGVPVQIDAGLRTATAIAPGDTHTCAVTDNHTVWCWGYNADGELGNGTTNNSTNAVEASGILTATAISSGLGNSCAVVAAGVKCWGQNIYGELGNGTTTNSSTPVTVVWP